MRNVQTGPDGDIAAALAFVHRLGRIEVADLEAVGRAWRAAVSDDPSAWFAAEGAVGQAVRTTRRQPAQEIVIEDLTEVVRRGGWWRLDHLAAAGGEGLTEAGVQYAATLAAIAILVRDVVPREDVELIYGPFAGLIPLGELDHAVDCDEGRMSRRG